MQDAGAAMEEVFPFRPRMGGAEVVWELDKIAEATASSDEERARVLTALRQYCAEAAAFARELGDGAAQSKQSGTDGDSDDEWLQRGSSSATTITTQGLVGFLAWYRATRSSALGGEGPDASSQVSPEELARHDGVSAPTIYLSLRGRVYDVTSGASFYGPGAGYSILAGHDCTRSLATMSLDFHDLDEPWYAPMAEDETQALDGWEAKFVEKYPTVGALKAPTLLDRVCKQMVRCVLGIGVVDSVTPPLGGPTAGSQCLGTELRPADALALAFNSGALLAPHRIGRDARTSALLSVVASATDAIERAAGAEIPPVDPATAAFRRCDAYDFAGDVAFQNGYKTVMAKIQQRDTLAHGTWDQALALAEAKAFYYSKCIEPVDVEGYVGWVRHARDGPSAEAQRSAVLPSVVDEPAAITTTITSSEHSDAPTTDQGAPLPKLSFEEVMALVAAGKEVPGCRKVEVEVQEGEEPSQSVSPRPPKPWEASSTQ